MRSFASLALPLILLTSIIAAPSPAAAGFEEDKKACTGTEAEADDGIAACTRLIDGKTGELAVFYYKRGSFWSEKDELDKAIEDYSKAIEIDPTYAKAYDGRGSAWTDKGEIERAFADYDQAIRLDPKDPHFWNNRGLLWKSEDDFERALADFNEAIKLDPAYTAAFTNRGLTYEARAEARYKADIERAKTEYKAALALPQKYSSGKAAHETAKERLDDLAEERRPSPGESSFDKDQKLCNSSDTKIEDGIAACTRQIESGRWEGHDLAISYYNRGIFWYDKEENDKAIADYTKAIELSPDYASAFNNRGNAFAAKGDLDRAIADYDRAIEIDPKDPFRWNNRGLAWKRKSQYDRAIADFDQAIKVDAGYTAAYTNRGETYEAKGDIERAKVDYLAALAVPQKYGNGKWAHETARDRLLALGAPAESLPPAARAGATPFEEDQRLCNSSDTKIDEGIAACTRQIASGRWTGHNLAISYYNRGIFHYDKDELDKAIDDYTKAIELSPEYSSAFNNRGNAWSAKGDLDRALADYDTAIRIDGKDPFRWNNRGLIYRRKADYDRAIADFDQAIKIDPGYTAAYTNRGQAYEDKGDIERAKSDYRAALAVPQKYANGKYAHDKANERLAALAARPPEPGPPQHR